VVAARAVIEVVGAVVATVVVVSPVAVLITPWVVVVGRVVVVSVVVVVSAALVVDTDVGGCVIRGLDSSLAVHVFQMTTPANTHSPTHIPPVVSPIRSATTKTIHGRSSRERDQLEDHPKIPVALAARP